MVLLGMPMLQTDRYVHIEHVSQGSLFFIAPKIDARGIARMYLHISFIQYEV
jgi:hypothetical protein